MAHEFTHEDYVWCRGWIKTWSITCGVPFDILDDVIQSTLVMLLEVAKTYGGTPTQRKMDFRAFAWSSVRFFVLRYIERRARSWLKHPPKMHSIDTSDKEAGRWQHRVHSCLACEDDDRRRSEVRDMVETVLSHIDGADRAVLEEWASGDTLVMVGARRNVSKQRAGQMLSMVVHKAREVARELFGVEAVLWPETVSTKTRVCSKVLNSRSSRPRRY